MKGNIRETLTQDTRRGSKEEAATCTNDGKSACGEKKEKGIRMTDVHPPVRS